MRGPNGGALLAYADPVYLGMAHRYSVPGTPEYHPEAGKWDTLEAHAELLAALERDYDGWACSMGSNNLQDILPIAPRGVRVGAWVKPWAVFRPNVAPAFAWEPVLFKPARIARPEARAMRSGRDWVAASTTPAGAAFLGAKPYPFCAWVFDEALAAEPGDTFVDLFPGSGAVTRAWEKWMATVESGRHGGPAQRALFTESA